MLWRPLNYQRERQKQRDQQSSTLVFARDKEHTLCLRLIWLRPVLSPIRIHNSLIIPTLPTSLELLTSTHQILCVPLCVCVWVCSLGFVNWVLRVHNSGFRSRRIWKLGVACAQFWFALLRVLCVWMECAMFASRSDECAQAGKRTERRRVYAPCG
jgi:hypothetical protein